jgi:hypothetical protein
MSPNAVFRYVTTLLKLRSLNFSETTERNHQNGLVRFGLGNVSVIMRTLAVSENARCDR